MTRKGEDAARRQTWHRRRPSGSRGNESSVITSVCWTIELQTGMAADNGILLVGTKDLSERTTSGTCNRLPISVAILLLNR